MPKRFPLLVFLRKEYGFISKLLEKKSAHSNGSAIVSGQPGTGEVLVFLFTQDLTRPGVLRQDYFPLHHDDRAHDFWKGIPVSNRRRTRLSRL